MDSLCFWSCLICACQHCHFSIFGHKVAILFLANFKVQYTNRGGKYDKKTYSNDMSVRFDCLEVHFVIYIDCVFASNCILLNIIDCTYIMNICNFTMILYIDWFNQIVITIIWYLYILIFELLSSSISACYIWAIMLKLKLFCQVRNTSSNKFILVWSIF